MATDQREEKKAVRKKSGRGRLVWVALLLVLAATGFWYLRREKDSSAEASALSHVQSTLHLETFVLNLADADQRSFLRVGIDLGLNHEPKRDEPAPVAQVRDTILSVLAEARLEDLMTAAGKTKLKENLLHALQERVPQLGILEVYFTEFLIQR